MRKPKDTDFFINLPDVGTFRFGRRTVGDTMAIRSAALKHTQGADDVELNLYATMVATHTVLCVEAPDGWADAAALDAKHEEKLFDLFKALREQEDSFRIQP